MEDILSQAYSILNSYPEVLIEDSLLRLPFARRFLELQRLGEMQEKIISEWAEEEGLWFNTYTDDSGK